MCTGNFYCCVVHQKNHISISCVYVRALTQPTVLGSTVFSANTSRTEGALIELPDEVDDRCLGAAALVVSCTSFVGKSVPAEAMTDVMLYSLRMVCSGSLTVFKAFK